MFYYNMKNGVINSNYLFVESNPINFIDSDGKTSFSKAIFLQYQQMMKKTFVSLQKRKKPLYLSSQIAMQYAKEAVRSYYSGNKGSSIQTIAKTRSLTGLPGDIRKYLDFLDMQKIAKSSKAPSTRATMLLGCMLLSEYESRREMVSKTTLSAQHAKIVIHTHSIKEQNNKNVADVNEIIEYVQKRKIRTCIRNEKQLK